MGKRQSGICGTISSVSGKTPEKPKIEVTRKVSQKILKNHKYYKMIFGEIGFQKFNFLFEIKIIRSTVNLGIHRIGRVLIKSDKSQKMYSDRKYDFEK